MTTSSSNEATPGDHNHPLDLSTETGTPDDRRVLVSAHQAMIRLLARCLAKQWISTAAARAAADAPDQDPAGPASETTP